MNENIFEDKYNRYKTMVFNISYSYLNNIFDTEDATQETFIRFYRKNKHFEQDSEERFYLIRITINVCKDILKAKKRYVKVSEDKMNDIPTIYDETHLKHNIFDYVEALKPKHKEIIIYKYIEDLSHKEIAQMLGIKEESARKRLERAIKELRKIWR